MKTKEQISDDRRLEDEIDLTVLLKKINSFFRGIGDAINRFKQFIYRNIKLLLVFMVLGVSLGYLAYTTTKPFFTSSMTLVLSDIRNDFVEDQLDKLSEMVQDDNFTIIADKLGISEASASQIKEMKFSNLDQDRIDEDSILTGSPFQIELTLYDNSLFSSMEPALVNYMEENRYFSKQKRINQKKLEGLISKLNVEIKSLDSLKTTVSSPRGPVNGFVYGEPIDPTNLYRESVAMYQNQLELQAQLEQIDNIQVVNGFGPRLKPTGPKLSYYLAVGAVFMFLVGLLVANIYEKRATS